MFGLWDSLIEGLALRLGLPMKSECGVGEGLGHLRGGLPSDRASAELVRAEGVRARGHAVVRIAQREHPRPETLEVGQRLVETIFGDDVGFAHVTLAPHVPLAEMPRGISGLARRKWASDGAAGSSHRAMPRSSLRRDGRDRT